MGVLYSIGESLVGKPELEEKAAIGSLRSFAEATEKKRPADIAFSFGSVRSADLPRQQEQLPFEPIGLNKPLSIELQNIYTGDAPGRSFIDKLVGRKKPDMLAVSGVRTPDSYGAAPRAVNQLVQDIDNKRYYLPGALREGATIVYHSPAMVNATTYVSFELVVDSFSEEIFSQFADLFQAAAGLPIFAPAASYLLAGSTLAKIGGQIGRAFLETSPFLKADESINLESGGLPLELSRFMVFVADSDLDKLEGYEVGVREMFGNHRVCLIDKQSGAPYAGPIPHLIASLDGRKRDEYRDFTVQHASAALIERFYGKETVSGVVDVLKDSLNLFNDMSYRQKAERIKQDLLTIDKNKEPEKYKKAEERFKAYLDNIQTKVLKEGLTLS